MSTGMLTTVIAPSTPMLSTSTTTAYQLPSENRISPFMRRRPRSPGLHSPPLIPLTSFPNSCLGTLTSLTSFPNSCLGTHSAKLPFRVRPPTGRETGVSRTPVPKQEFGHEGNDGKRSFAARPCPFFLLRGGRIDRRAVAEAGTGAHDHLVVLGQRPAVVYL